MASIGNNPLHIQDERFECGAAFKLSSCADIDWTYECSGNSTSVSAASNYITVAITSATMDRDQLLLESHEAAAQSLDVLSMEHMISRRVERAEDHHILWWRDQGKTQLRMVFTMALGGHVSVKATVTRADGTIVPEPEYIPPKWDPAMRYFRLSQANDDLFDAYRLMFLALESILSRVKPLTSQSDTDWWKKSLGWASTQVDIRKYLLKQSTTNPVNELFEEQYKARRCALFHSKRRDNPLLPSSMAERTFVANALQRLTSLVVELCKNELGVRALSGGLAVGILDSFFTVLNDNCAITIAVQADTPEFSNLTVADQESDWTGLPMRAMRCRSAYPSERRFRAKVDVSDLTETLIQSYAVWVPKSATELDFYGLLAARLRQFKFVAPLDLNGVDKFEIIARLVIDNPRESRSRFIF